MCKPYFFHLIKSGSNHSRRQKYTLVQVKLLFLSSQIHIPEFSVVSFSFFVLIFLNLELWFCSRVIDAQAPLAIVIPAKGSSFSMKLRDGDISWLDFLERVRKLKYGHFFCLNPTTLLICMHFHLSFIIHI